MTRSPSGTTKSDPTENRELFFRGPLAMTMWCGLPILAARYGFIRGHCGKVATKAPSGRVTGASAQAAIHLQLRAVLSVLSTFNIGQCRTGGPSSSSGSALWPVFSCRRVPAVNRERVRRWPFAVVLSCSFSINRRPVLLLQWRCNHTQKPPVRASWNAPGKSRTGNTRVASDQALSGRSGVVPHDRSAQANLSAPAVRWSETLT